MDDSQLDNTMCAVRHNQRLRGIFYGDSPFFFDTPVFLAQLSIAALVTAIMQHFFTPLGQSAFISQVLAGIILGPSFLGGEPEFRDRFFPISSFYTVDTFAYFGVMLFLFIIGVKTDLSLIRKCGKKALAIGISAFSVPLLLNFAIGQIITHSVPLEPSIHRSIQWITSFQALSSSHVIICLLADLKLMNSELGRLAISSSMMSGICSWLWAVMVLTGKQSLHIRKVKTFLLMLLFLGAMVFCALFIFRPTMLWIIRRTNNPRSLKESNVCMIFVFILGSALFGEMMGQHFLFGPIILGVVVPDGPPLGTAILNRLELFVSSIMLPIYFVVTGARIDFSAISMRNFVVIEFLAVCSLIWKVAGVMVPSLYCKMPINDALYLGLILSNQGIIEVLILGRAQTTELIDKQTYSIMVVSILMFTGILAPIVKFSYKPFKRYTTQERMTIQHIKPTSELRILACIHYQEHTPSLINLFEASYPNPSGPICFYVVHLIELAGRSASLLVDHHPRNGIPDPSRTNESEHIINALRFFEHEHRGSATVYPFTSISPHESMHDDVCSLAAEKKVSLVIVLFHRHPVIHIPEGESNAIRAVNTNISLKSPCTVGILVDNGAMTSTGSMLSQRDVCRVGVIFLGGADDREALAFGCRMAKHPNIGLTLIRFLDLDLDGTFSMEMRLDLDIINAFRDDCTKNSHCEYQEVSVKDSVGVIGAIRSIESAFDLILVGRWHDKDSRLLVGLEDWNEFPELGSIGGLFVSLESDSKVSVLVMQQMNEAQDSFVAFETTRWNSFGRVWPLH
ncbi:cation/H(+) antiporter 15 [Dorcoceras hygrometricum]|uniref:Cation/H(+) antiporter 15 n=1 Tax=Dorcoceras hygrometricum TaxID=472368 RepID=A0A2Z7AQC0_9LAMI|nr:cation/H(+) antiporter 15 [Dorcoceras hygrometricum]